MRYGSARIVALTGVLAFTGWVGNVRAASDPPSECKKIIAGWTAAPNSDDLTLQIRGSLTSGSAAISCIWQVAFSDLVAGDIARKVQKASNAIQTGAPAGAGGTTSATSKPGTPFSLATEYTGITSSTSNQTITFQIPLDGIPRALATHGDWGYCTTTLIIFAPCVGSGWLNQLNRFGASVSMNTATSTNAVTATATGASQGSTQQVTTKPTGNTGPSFSSASLKYQIYKPTATLTAPSSATAAAATTQIGKLAALGLNPNDGQTRYGRWAQCVISQMSKAGVGDRYLIFAKYFTQVKQVLRYTTEVDCSDALTGAVAAVPESVGDTQLAGSILDYIRSAMTAKANFDTDVLTAMQKAGTLLVAFEYDYATPQNQQSNSTYKLDFSKDLIKADPNGSGSPLSATLNIGASTFNSTPPASVPGSSLLRSLQAGIEFDSVINSSKWPGWLGKIGDSTASLAYYYQDQTSPSILKVTPGTPLSGITFVGLPSTATQVFTAKGPINLGQLKWGLGTGKNVKFPIAFTYSSRSELITHPVAGVQFGVSYDFTSLLPGTAGSGGN